MNEGIEILPVKKRVNWLFQSCLPTLMNSTLKDSKTVEFNRTKANKN